MGTRMRTSSPASERRQAPAKTPEAREQQSIALAVDLAEKQLREGTASSQVITHYLKLGSTKARLENEILELQKELIAAKTEQLKSAKAVEELYSKALTAMGIYRGEKSESSQEGDDDE